MEEVLNEVDADNEGLNVSSTYILSFNTNRNQTFNKISERQVIQ